MEITNTKDAISTLPILIKMMPKCFLCAKANHTFKFLTVVYTCSTPNVKVKYSAARS